MWTREDIEKLRKEMSRDIEGLRKETTSQGREIKSLGSELRDEKWRQSLGLGKSNSN